jgi:hypothetical protein
MEDLPVLFETSPDLQQINLEFSEIESLEPLLPLLSKFTALKELLLFGNRLESLPQDLSCLSSLTKLDISNNLIENLDQALLSLSTLPNLVDLHYSTQNESEEKQISLKLPNLQLLNNNQVIHVSYPSSEKSSADLDQIEEVTEKCETTNPGKFQENVAESRESEIPDVERTYAACEHSGYFGEDAFMSQDYVEKVAILYDEIRGLWQSEDRSRDKKLAEDFDEGIRSIVVDLSGVIRSDYSQISKKLHTIKSKYELVLICIQKLVDFLMRKSPNLGKFFVQLNKIVEDLFNELLSVSLEAFASPLASNASLEPKSPKSPRMESFDNFLVEKEMIFKRFANEREELLMEIDALKEENTLKLL